MTIDERIKNNTVFRLVEEGFKPAGNFSIPLDKKYNLQELKDQYPHLYLFWNPRNTSFLEVINVDLYKKTVAMFYGKKHPLYTISEYKKYLSPKNKLKFEDMIFFGRIFGYPEVCIDNFIKNFKEKEGKIFIKTSDNQIIICCYEEKSIKAAKAYIKKIENFLG